jgi:hypothetical protein
VTSATERAGEGESTEFKLVRKRGGEVATAMRVHGAGFERKGGAMREGCSTSSRSCSADCRTKGKLW